jgi:NhaP-type Na+/H+ or K+/H+ antiporter
MKLKMENGKNPACHSINEKNTMEQNSNTNTDINVDIDIDIDSSKRTHSSNSAVNLVSESALSYSNSIRLHICALLIIVLYATYDLSASASTSTSTVPATSGDSTQHRFLNPFLKFNSVQQQHQHYEQNNGRSLFALNDNDNSNNNNDNNDNNNDIDPSNKICRNYLKQFLSGTTDVRDECEGLENAYAASDCQSTEDKTKTNNNLNSVNDNNDSDNGNGDADNNNDDNENDDDNDNDTTPAIDDFFEEFECCQVISHYYSSKCLYHQRYASLSLLGIVSVLILCSLMKTMLHSCKLIPLQWLPEAGGCIIVGAVVSLIFTSIQNHSGNDSGSGTSTTAFDYDSSFNDELFMYILLPPIIFQASLSIHKKQFTKLLYPILMFAIFGTFLSSILIGYIVHYCTLYIPENITKTIPLLDSLLYGSLISSVDPVATLSILGSMGIATDHILYVVVFGESILNDGVAIALFDSLKMHLEKNGSGDGVSNLRSISTSTRNLLAGVDSQLAKESIKYFFKICLGSISIGLLIGVLCTVYFWLLRGKQSPVMEVGSFFCFAFMAYYSSDSIGCSGIVSIMTSGFIMDIYVRGYKLSERDEEYELGRSLSDEAGGAGAMSGEIGDRSVDDVQNELAGGLSTTGPRCCWDNQCTFRSFITDCKIMFSGVGHMSHRAKVHVGFVADVLANLMETSIFAYLGLFLFSNNKWDDIPLALIGILSCVLSRVVMIGVTSFIVNGGIMLNNYLCHYCKKMSWSIGHRFRNNNDDTPMPIELQQQPTLFNNGNSNNDNDNIYIDRNMQLVLLYSGVRGAVSLALAENIPLYDAVTKNGSEFKPALKAMTSSSIAFTVFFFGASTYFTLKKQRERINQPNNENSQGTSVGNSRGRGGIRGFFSGILNREILEDDEALYDLSFQDNTRAGLTTSLLESDEATGNEGRQMPPWMMPSPTGGS